MFPPGLTEAMLSVHLQKNSSDTQVHTLHDGHRNHLIAIHDDGTRDLYTYAGRWHITDSHSHTFAPGTLHTLRELADAYEARPHLAITALLRDDAHVIRTIIIPLQWLDSLNPEEMPFGHGIRLLKDGGLLLTYSVRTWKYLQANSNISAFDYVLQPHTP